MKFLKLLGIVIAAHVAVFLFIFAIPGCRSSGKPAASGADAPASSPVASTGGADASPVQSVALPSGSPVSDAPTAPTLSSPTRPGTAEAGLLATQSAAPVAAQPASAYTVAKGDSLWSIAKKNHVTVSELRSANHLKGNDLRLGQHLVIPGKSAASSAVAPATDDTAPRTYTVKAGDTLSAVARHAGTTKAELRKLNKLRSDNLHAGQILTLPAATPHASAVHSSHSAGVAASEGQGGAAGGADYVVKSGDSLGGIAHRFHVKVGDLAAANNIADPTKIRVGQKLRIPGGHASAGSKASTSSDASAISPAPDAAPASASPVSDAPLFSSPVAPAASTSPSAPVSSPLFTPAPAASTTAPEASPVDASTAGVPVVPVQDSPANQ